MRVLWILMACISLNALGQNNYPYVNQHDDDISCIAFSPDNNYIVSGGWDGKLMAYHNDSTYRIKVDLKEFKGAVKSLAFSRDGFKMIAGGQEGKLALYHFNDYNSWDVIGLDTALEINKAQINKLIYGPGMRTVFSAGDDGKFLTYDLAKKKVITLDTKRPISAAAVAVDRRSFFIANEGDPTIKQYNVFGKEIRTFTGHTNDITDILVSPNRKYLITSSRDRTVKIWNVVTGKIENTLMNHNWFVSDIDLDTYGKYLASCGLDGKVNLYEVETGELLKQETLPKNRCNAIAISPDLTKIAVATHQDNNPDHSGFYILTTDLAERTVRTPKRYIADKEERELYEMLYEEKDIIYEGEEEPSPTASPKTKKETKAIKTTPKTKETVIRKTNQVEIRRDD